MRKIWLHFKMIGPVAVALSVAVIFSGCAQRMYVKPGGTAETFEADKFDCQTKVVTMYGGYANMGLGHAIMARDDMDRCLVIKGWQQQEQ